MSAFSFNRHVLPFIVATGGEFVALYYWLICHDQQRIFLGTVLLWSGFLVERLAVLAWVRYVYNPADPEAKSSLTSVPIFIVALLGVTLSEIIIWAIWLHLADYVEPWLAAAFFLVFMQLQHAIEMARLKRQPLFSYITSKRTFFYTLMEVIGAGAWLALWRHGHQSWGALCILIGLAVEHVIQGSALRPDIPAKPVRSGELGSSCVI